MARNELSSKYMKLVLRQLGLKDAEIEALICAIEQLNAPRALSPL
jgi:hypothetical protein